MRFPFFRFVPALLLAIAPASWAALPDCRSAESDSDGDGFGWENGQSCKVVRSGHPTCQRTDSDPDQDGFGWENGATCIVVRKPPVDRPNCQSADADPDGDGWGWENGRSCRVVATRPFCQSADADPDGDGYGWENGTTCIVRQNYRPTAIAPSGDLTTGTPVFRWTATANAESYRIVVRDAGGSGYQRSIDASRAGCADGTGQCAFQPQLGYFDNDLKWYVEAVVDGTPGARSNTLEVTTPFSPNMQAIKSSTSECEAWASVAYDKFVVLNNAWNARTMNRPNWSQTIVVDQGLDDRIKPTWTYNWLGRFDGDEIEVKAYPEVLYGSKLGTHVSGTKAETGLPETVRNLPEFTVNYAFTETGEAERNVALESFFHDSCDIKGPCDDVDNRVYEMMIWVNNPTIRTPGKLALTGVLIDNQLWNVYIKPDSNKHYIAFTAQTSQTQGTLNWNRFVDWTLDWTTANAETLKIDALSADFCMGAIELGTEMWWGSGSFTLDRFDVDFTR